VNVGVLALQGAFREHKQVLEKLGARVREVRLPQHLGGLDAVIVPGGESTTMARLMKAYAMNKGLVDFYAAGGALWGTCAGAIVMASEIVGHPEQLRLGLIDIAVERNAYGRQVASFEADLDVAVEGFDEPFHAIFIRAPRIARAAEGVEVLARYEGDPVMVRQDRVMASVFHPELSDDSRLHRYFLERVVAQ
jgi:5'-phosphate synthase pdxT subunit